METINNGITIVSSQLNRLKNQLSISVLVGFSKGMACLLQTERQSVILKINPRTSIGQKGEILTRGSHSGKTNEGAERIFLKLRNLGSNVKRVF